MSARAMTPDETGLMIDWEKVSRTRTQMMVRYHETLLHCHTFDTSNATSRRRFAVEVVEKAGTRFGATLAIGDVEQALLESAEATAALPEAPRVPPDYEAVEAEDPRNCGLYRNGPDGPVQICNFVM